MQSQRCTCVPSLLILWQGTDAIFRHSNSVYTSCCVFIMFKKTENPAACEMWSVICFLIAKNMKMAEIHQLCYVYGEHAMSSSMVWRWVWLFNEGRGNVHDDPRSGWPSVVNEDLVHAIEEKIRENRWFTIMSFSLHFPQISWSLLHEIVSDKLKFQKLCARWVPKMLKEEHKLKRQASALDFLTRYSEEGDNFLNHDVTGDKTWVSHTTPESKQQSMEWRHTSSPTKMKFTHTTSTQKIMCTVFWDRKGVLLVDFLPQGNTCVYCDTLKKLRCAIQNKQRGMLSWGVVMIHDNACPHTAAAMQNLITTFGWEQFDHLPYSPDLAPSDFHLFLHLKSFLAGQQFHDDEVKETLPHTLHRRRHHSMMKGYKNWCNTMTSASTMVETMSKSIVQYVHQMALYKVCNIFLFFLNSPLELTFWITLVHMA